MCTLKSVEKGLQFHKKVEEIKINIALSLNNIMYYQTLVSKKSACNAEVALSLENFSNLLIQDHFGTNS